jgi:hypothetical protein
MIRRGSLDTHKRMSKGWGEGCEKERTRIDDNLVSTRLHRLVVVAREKLPESRQTGSPHPDLKVLVLAQVRDRVLVRVASAREPFDPERWRDALIVGVR